MENKKNGQVLTIILCIALIAGVIFAKTFTKDKEKNNNVADNNETIESSQEESKSEEMTMDNTVQDETEENSKIDESNFGGENLKNVDTSNYEENNIEGEALPEGETQINFAFTNGEVLYDRDFPSGIYKNIKEDFQKYINENIPNPESIKKIDILEDSITETEDKLSFKVDLKNGTILLAEVDLYTFVYSFSIVK